MAIRIIATIKSKNNIANPMRYTVPSIITCSVSFAPPSPIAHNN